MKTLFVTFLLFAFYGSARVYGQEFAGTGTPVVVYQAPLVVQYLQVYPPVVYRPQVQMVPYQLQRVEATPWRTPLRSMLFGPMRMTPVYAPQVP